MKKALKNKLSGTKKFVRNVLSKKSAGSHESLEHSLEIRMAEESMLKNELESLKDQIANLKAAITSLQNETEQKEIAIANIAREKEKIHLDLLKTKRSNASLTKQLEDEREFYLKEKEMYCQEMNECKKLKQQFSGISSGTEEKTVEEYKTEITKLKQALNQTLEANYNLSIKFLRMKNTKTCLKTELHTLKFENAKIENDFKNKIENLTIQLNDLINEKMLWPISPSNKKYLQLVKQNSCLTYENFCLQLELDTLNYKFDKHKMEHLRSETNSRLKYIHHNTSDNKIKKRSENTFKHAHHNEIPEKLEMNPNNRPSYSKSISDFSGNNEDLNRPSCSKYQSDTNEKIVKIYERKQYPDVPEITIVNEKNTQARRPKRSKDVKNARHLQAKTEPKVSSVSKPERKVDKEKSQETYYSQDVEKKSSDKFALFQISDAQSVPSSDFFSLPHIVRSFSSPDLHQKKDS